MKNLDNARLNDNTSASAAAAANDYGSARNEAYNSMAEFGKKSDKSSGYPMPKLQINESGKGDMDFSPKESGRDGGMKDNFEGKGKDNKEGKDGKDNKEGKGGKDLEGKDLQYQDPNGQGDLKDKDTHEEQHDGEKESDDNQKHEDQESRGGVDGDAGKDGETEKEVRDYRNR